MLPNNTFVQGRYQIIEQIGRGGMGAVYKATDIRLRTTVALKQTLVEGEPLRRAFEREAQLLASLHHSALPRVSDHFIDHQGQFLVMEYVGGDDLGALLELRKRSFELAVVLRWADQLLDVLEYLHTHQPPIIHRDIKPQNIKLTARNDIKLLDFGLAKGSLAQTRVTATGSIFGYTPHYAPLEQIHGTGTDHRSDLYSLGATLYHLLTNKIPVDALARASAKVNDEPDPLARASDINPDVPPSVAAILHQAMAQNANQRPPTAVALRDSLREAGKNITATDVNDQTVVHIPGNIQTVIPTAPIDSGVSGDAAARQVVLPVPISASLGSSPIEGAASMKAVDSPKLPSDVRPSREISPRPRWIWAIIVVPLLLVIGAIGFFLARQGDLSFQPTITIVPATSIAAVVPTPILNTATPTDSATEIAQTVEARIQAAVNSTSIALATNAAVAAQQTADVSTAQAVAAQQTADASTAQAVAAQQTADASTAQAIAAAAATEQSAAQQTANAKPTRPALPTRTPGPTRTPKPTPIPDTAGECRVSGGGGKIRGSCSPGAQIAGTNGSCITGSVVARDGSQFQSFLVFVDTGGAPPEFRLERHDTSTYSVCGLGAGTWGVAVAAVNDIPYDGSEQGAHLVILRLSGADGEHFVVNFREL